MEKQIKYNPTKEKIILGIDPGTNVLGYGIISVLSSSMQLIGAGIVQVSQEKDHPLKLKRIFEQTTKIIEQYRPHEISVEAPFYGKNVQSMLKLGRAQGVAMAAGIMQNIQIFEYAPKKIKQSITGNGNASKEQVAAMLKSLLNFKESPQFLDATDGLAAAVCHHFQSTGFQSTGKTYNGWKDYISKNPEKR